MDIFNAALVGQTLSYLGYKVITAQNQAAQQEAAQQEAAQQEAPQEAQQEAPQEEIPIEEPITDESIAETQDGGMMEENVNEDDEIDLEEYKAGLDELKRKYNELPDNIKKMDKKVPKLITSLSLDLTLKQNLDEIGVNYEVLESIIDELVKKHQEGEGNVKFENVRWGAFTRNLNAYNEKHNTAWDLYDFARYIQSHPEEFSTKLLRRALFYLNVLHQHGRGPTQHIPKGALIESINRIRPILNSTNIERLGLNLDKPYRDELVDYMLETQPSVLQRKNEEELKALLSKGLKYKNDFTERLKQNNR